uniref:Uncharacterized protein n=1 Tax=Knipowitschia caucasica TaxID=637954 RepID=A0AAV2LQZ4_KNICA
MLRHTTTNNAPTPHINLTPPSPPREKSCARREQRRGITRNNARKDKRADEKLCPLVWLALRSASRRGAARVSDRLRRGWLRGLVVGGGRWRGERVRGVGGKTWVAARLLVRTRGVAGVARRGRRLALTPERGMVERVAASETELDSTLPVGARGGVGGAAVRCGWGYAQRGPAVGGSGGVAV